VLEGYRDSLKPIDDLLRNGERVFPIATDDAHKLNACFGGFVMVKAEKLEYKTIFDALKKGDFYSSVKPEIYDLWFEDGVVHIQTSKAKRIELVTDRRITMIATGSDLFNEVTFDISSLFLFKDNDIERIQKTIRNLINSLSSCGLTASQTSNEDLRIILDNFLNGGTTTEFGTVVTL
jgi:hypothetical protein